MPHFFINSKDIEDNFISICDKELLSHLVLSLRVKSGEKVKFIDENEIQYLTFVCEVSKNNLRAEIIEKFKSKRKLNYSLNLIQAVLKPDAQTLAISAATQCGVDKIFPVISDNYALSKKSLSEDKIQKWQKIANEAAKQCERANFATVENFVEFDEILPKFDKKNILIYAEKYSNIELDCALNDVDKNLPIAVVVGPEGGFSEREFQYFIENNYKMISLGELIFKAPNAICAGVSNIVTRLK